MLEEQLKTIRLFKEHYDSKTVEPFVLYGTGINAEAVIKSCEDYPVAGTMDASKTGQNFCGKKVLSEEEVLKLGIHLVVVIARPAVRGIIYKRLKPWSEKHGIRIQDIQGNNIADIIKENKCESPYFNVSYEELISEINSHEIISFDIFDTVLMRRVYEPTDVFLLLDEEVKEKVPERFSIMRKEAERELLKEGEPDLYQIYARMGEKYHLTQKICCFLMNMELEKEREVLIVRKKMRECIEYCLKKNKRLFFVSDMYLPADILREFLNQFEITGYEDILVSCEYHVSKRNGLFQVLKEKAQGNSYLHIGDNKEADYHAAKENEIDAFLIMPAIRMMEISTWKNALTYLGGLESRLMLGLLASELFNDPFALYHSEGKPRIEENQYFGYLLIAPLAVSFLLWIMEKTRDAGQAVLLFSARDGWLMQKLYRQLVQRFQMEHMPQDKYLLISRRAVTDLEKNQDRKENYLNYLADLKLEAYEKIYFFDFMSRGTCQYYLEQLIHRSCYGLYVQKGDSSDKEKKQLNVESYFKEHCAQDADRKIFALCDFLECIFTSFEPSFLGFQGGTVVYEKERRTASQIACIKGIHEGICNYAIQFADILGRMPKEMPSADFCDEVLNYISASYSQIEIPELAEMVLDDEVFGDKNTGRDALI